MKKAISIILTIITFYTIHSCRQENDDVNQEEKKENLSSDRSITAKEEDSIKTISTYGGIDDGTTIPDGDPPPKNGGQWRIND